MRRRLAKLALGVLLAGAFGTGCARPLKVAHPTEDVDYVVVQVPGMVPQARLERCTKAGCTEVYDAKREKAASATEPPPVAPTEAPE